MTKWHKCIHPAGFLPHREQVAVAQSNEDTSVSDEFSIVFDRKHNYFLAPKWRASDHILTSALEVLKWSRINLCQGIFWKLDIQMHLGGCVRTLMWLLYCRCEGFIWENIYIYKYYFLLNDVFISGNIHQSDVSWFIWSVVGWKAIQRTINIDIITDMKTNVWAVL